MAAQHDTTFLVTLSESEQKMLMDGVKNSAYQLDRLIMAAEESNLEIGDLRKDRAYLEEIANALEANLDSGKSWEASVSRDQLQILQGAFEYSARLDELRHEEFKREFPGAKDLIRQLAERIKVKRAIPSIFLAGTGDGNDRLSTWGVRDKLSFF